MADTIKFAFIFFLFLVFAPAAGFAIRPYRWAQRAVFFLMVFLTIGHVNYIMMSPGFGDFYRGHTRGYEFTIMEVMAIILLFVGRAPADRTHSRMPPGLYLWLAYCFVGLLSIVNSVDWGFTMMAVVKFTKIIVIFAATYVFLRDEDDLQFWLKSIAILLVFQAVLVIVQKYAYGLYPAEAWFEHQNPLAMFSYMLALPLLAAGLATAKPLQTTLYLTGYVAGGLCVQSSFSRAGIAMFMVGTALVVVLSLLDRITLKRVVLVILMGLFGVMAVIPAMDTVVARFNDSFNVNSAETRETLNRCSRKMIEDYPILGTGWNTYGVMINPPYKYGDPFYELTHTRGHKVSRKRQVSRTISESWYYLMLAETGFLGTAAMFVFFLTLLYWNARAMITFRHTLLGAVAIGLFAAMSLTYVQSNLERVLTQPKNLTAWMFCLGVVAKLESWRRQKFRPGFKAPVPQAPAPIAPQPAAPAPKNIFIPPPGPHIRPAN